MAPSGFDPDKYVALQSERIADRLRRFGGKLYLEFGGKLFDDTHAARVLPGFTPDNKMRMLEAIKERVEVIVVISAEDIASNKIRGDLGITYEQDVLRHVDEFRAYGLHVGGIVVTRMTPGNSAARAFVRRLTRAGLAVAHHFPIPRYPSDVDLIVSEKGYGKNDYLQTSRDLIVVTAPAAGSGKMAACLSQIYHDHVRGISSGYAKFETFPIWNLPLDHPVNLAYEAATADLADVNLIDPYHLAAYDEQAVSYNRDVEVFPVLKRLFEGLMGESPYASPTDMGVNMAGYCISDDAVVRDAATQEILRRYFKALVAEKREDLDPVASNKIALLMSRLGVAATDRPVVQPARDLAAETNAPAAAIELLDGQIVLGKTSTLLGSSSSVLLNALKTLAGIDHDTDLLARSTIEPIQQLKTERLGSKNPRLHTDEVLIALAVGATTSEIARRALDQLPKLRGTDVHTSVILGSVDEAMFRNLGVQVTSEPVFQSKNLYRKP